MGEGTQEGGRNRAATRRPCGTGFRSGASVRAALEVVIAWLLQVDADTFYK